MTGRNRRMRIGTLCLAAALAIAPFAVRAENAADGSREETLARCVASYEDREQRARFLEDPQTLDLLAGAARAWTRARPYAAAGGIVTLGRFEQDGDSGNGPEPIEWIVLEADGAGALLLSRYGLDARPWHEPCQPVTWEDCALRAWLNGEFLNGAMSEEERGMIARAAVRNGRSEGYAGYKVPGGRDTEDAVFLLSYREVSACFPEEAARACAPTRHAESRGARVDRRTERGVWWLRSPGGAENGASIVRMNGDTGSELVNKKGVLVRPAIRLDFAAAGFLPDGADALTEVPDELTACLPEAFVRRALALSETGDGEGCRAALDAAAEFAEDGAELAKIALCREGTGLLAAGDWKGAAGALTAAGAYADSARRAAGICYERGLALREAGETAAAAEAFRLAGAYPGAEEALAAAEEALRLETERAARARRYETPGSVVTFGRYEQDGNDENGPEPLEWIVLGASPEGTLLLSRYGLRAEPYDSAQKETSWAECGLRMTLKYDFLPAAFSAEEEAALVTEQVQNGPEEGCPDWPADGGDDTWDKVFLLSWREWEALPAEAWICLPSARAALEGAHADDESGAGRWWLRSPGYTASTAAFVFGNGEEAAYDGVTRGGILVRPAIRVNAAQALRIEDAYAGE